MAEGAFTQVSSPVTYETYAFRAVAADQVFVPGGG